MARVTCVGAVLALAASLLWGASDFGGGLASRRLPAIAVFGISNAIGGIVIALVALATGAWHADPGYWPWAAATAILGMAGMLLFYEALAIGPMGIVAPLVGLSVVVPVVVGLVGGERPSALQLLGMALAVVGVVLASGPELGDRRTARPVALSVLAIGCLGVVYILMAKGAAYSPIMATLGMRVTTVLLMLIVLLAKRTFGGVSRRDLPILTGVGVGDAAANLSFAFATTMGLLSVIAVLGALYPVVTALLAAGVLRERLRPIQYLGVAATMAGIVLVSSGL